MPIRGGGIVSFVCVCEGGVNITAKYTTGGRGDHGTMGTMLRTYTLKQSKADKIMGKFEPCRVVFKWHFFSDHLSKKGRAFLEMNKLQ